MEYSQRNKWMIVMRGTLWRREFLNPALRNRGWLLVYGRRKTGKTFMTRLLAPWSLYLTITRDNAVVFEDTDGHTRVVELGKALGEALEYLRREQVLVIDEFQRLPQRYWQLLANQHPRGRLILVASSLGIVSRVLDARSPLLGLVNPLRIDVISYSDVVASLYPRIGAQGALKWGILLREPWLAHHATIAGEPWEYLAVESHVLAQTVRGLLGEVFQEEERELTRLYEAVLRLLGAGYWSSSKLAGLLYSRGLLSSASTPIVTGILEKMSEMGLVAKTRLWKTRGARVYYRHRSPLLGVVFGLMEKWGVDELPPTPGWGSLVEAARSLYSRELQFTLGEMLSEHHRGVQSYSLLPRGEGDIDVLVLDRRSRKPLTLYEVKLGACGRPEARRALKLAEIAGVPRAGIACLGGVEESLEGVRALGPSELVGIAVDAVKKALKGRWPTAGGPG